MNAHVRILGTDASGKTELCNALEAANPEILSFSRTPKYVHRWLRTYNIGRSSDITPGQIDTREHIFLRANEHEAHAIGDILEMRPVVAVRGRADTVLTHAALRAQTMPHDINTLFPPGMRPDLLVMLIADPSTIESRLDARGQRKTGANSMAFHVQCRELYEDVARLGARHFPVLTFNTSDSESTPQMIAQSVQTALVQLST